MPREAWATRLVISFLALAIGFLALWEPGRALVRLGWAPARSVTRQGETPRVLINEIMPNGSDGQPVWVELVNPSDQSISLESLTLAIGGQQHDLPASAPDLDPHSFALVIFDSGPDEPPTAQVRDGVVAIHLAPDLGSPFNPAGDQVALYSRNDGRNDLLDFVAWDYAETVASDAAQAEYDRALVAGLWEADTYVWSSSGNRPAATLLAGESIGRFPRRSGVGASIWRTYVPSETTPGRENSAISGFVFLDGQYLQPPYALTESDGEIAINGRVVRRIPDTSADDTPPPADPRTAAELAVVGASRLTALGGLASEDTTRDLVGLLRSLPATADVRTADDYLVITDTAGDRTVLWLDTVQPPTRDELLEGQRLRASAWQHTLDEGGALLLTDGISVESPAGRAAGWMAQLVSLLGDPSVGQMDRLTALVGDDTLAAALAGAGPPSADLLARVLPPPPPETVSPAGLGTASGRAEAAEDANDPLVTAAQFTTRTPGTLRAYFFMYFGWLKAADPIREAALLHGYATSNVYESAKDCGPGGLSIGKFAAASGNAGILYVSSHSSTDLLTIAHYCTKDAAQAEVVAARRDFPGIVNEGGLDTSGNYTAYSRDEKVWQLVIGERFIKTTWGPPAKNRLAIVEIAGCHSGGHFQDVAGIGLQGAFEAREFVGTRYELGFCASDEPNASLWERLSGVVDSGEKRLFEDAYNASDFPKLTSSSKILEFSGALWVHRGSGRTVLSPGVMQTESGTSELDGSIPVYRVGQRYRTLVLFDTPMVPNTEISDTPPAAKSLVELKSGAVDPSLMYLAGGCRPQSLGPGRWFEGGRQLAFDWTPRAQGTVRFRINAGRALSADNNVKLDGNTNPTGTNHVGPNGDDFVWNALCVAAPADSPGTVAPPTPSNTPTPTDTPTPTETPTDTPTPTSSATPTLSTTPTITSTPTITPTPMTSTPTPSPSPTATSGTVTATSTPSLTATPSITSTPVPPPTVSPISATFNQSLFATTYLVVASDPTGRPLSYSWSGPNCGSALPYPTAPDTYLWQHPHPPCDATTDHSNITITLLVSNGVATVRCTYQGAATGTGPPCQRL